MIYPEIRMILRDEAEYHRLANRLESTIPWTEPNTDTLARVLEGTRSGRPENSYTLPPSIMNVFERLFGS